VTRVVRLQPGAQTDLRRLGEFLGTKSPAAARRAVAAISEAVLSLTENAERGRPAPAPGFRELHIRFGRDGYIARYRVDDDVVLVTRITHTRERR